ncbi:hypothetical protein PAMC26577_00910 [Caballeronia sordidicola]|uniref:Uncharacterized protein n=1 Tax=Caballeronia sordidicola TaxID=196367 RepID=A0A242N713_CABSO|nr:hypothetical protein PAMC26577_00910 [Caballeronia sordidicola]
MIPVDEKNFAFSILRAEEPAHPRQVFDCKYRLFSDGSDATEHLPYIRTVLIAKTLPKGRHVSVGGLVDGGAQKRNSFALKI